MAQAQEQTAMADQGNGLHALGKTKRIFGIFLCSLQVLLLYKDFAGMQLQDTSMIGPMPDIRIYWKKVKNMNCRLTSQKR